MLANGLIQPSNSFYSLLVLLVWKPDGSWWMYIDYRDMNNITIKDKFSIPTINELLDEIYGATYFSILDLKSSYHQVQIYEDDIPKIAFRTHEGHYEFLVIPFGLTNLHQLFKSL